MSGCGGTPKGCSAVTTGIDARCGSCGRLIRTRSRPGFIRVVFWNKWNFAGASKFVKHLTDPLGIAAGWDVALLVECTDTDVDALRNQFPVEDIAAFSDFDVDRGRRKPHGPVVIVRNGVAVVDKRPTFAWSKDPLDPKGDKSVSVEVSAGFGSLTLLSAHVMNGGDGADGWLRKLRTYERLEEELAPGKQPWPVVVGMDGNVWEDHLDVRPATSTLHHAQARFHSGAARHALSDTLRTAVLRSESRSAAALSHLRRYDGIAGTHRLSHTVTRFDRIYVSPDIEVLDAGVDEAALAVSDHALVWADLLLPSNRIVTEPVLEPKGSRKGRAAARELALEEVAYEVTRPDKYGWNRRGYLARVALASVGRAGCASQAFVDAHYPGVANPSQQWSPARSTTNRSWRTLGGGRFGSELVTYRPDLRAHEMRREHALVVVSQLGIGDLVDQVDRADLEEVLRDRLSP